MIFRTSHLIFNFWHFESQLILYLFWTVSRIWSWTEEHAGIFSWKKKKSHVRKSCIDLFDRLRWVNKFNKQTNCCSSMNKFYNMLNLKTVLSCVLLQLSTGEWASNKIKFIQKCSSVSLFKLKTNWLKFFPFLPKLNQITSSPFGLLSSVFIFETSKHCSLQEVKYLKVGLKSGLSSYNCFNYQS